MENSLYQVLHSVCARPVEVFNVKNHAASQASVVDTAKVAARITMTIAANIRFCNSTFAIKTTPIFATPTHR
jgi:hypothetical protein